MCCCGLALQYKLVCLEDTWSAAWCARTGDSEFACDGVLDLAKRFVLLLFHSALKHAGGALELVEPRRRSARVLINTSFIPYTSSYSSGSTSMSLPP